MGEMGRRDSLKEWIKMQRERRRKEEGRDRSGNGEENEKGKKRGKER